MEGKVVYLNEKYTHRLISIWILGVVPNKPYFVIEHTNKGYSYFWGKPQSRYKIQDDYGNVRWVDSHYFYDLEEWRESKINKLLD
jgi:hypothetical protein